MKKKACPDCLRLQEANERLARKIVESDANLRMQSEKVRVEAWARMTENKQERERLLNRIAELESAPPVPEVENKRPRLWVIAAALAAASMIVIIVVHRFGLHRFF